MSAASRAMQQMKNSSYFSLATTKIGRVDHFFEILMDNRNIISIGHATSAPQKNLVLPQEKLPETRCLQFAARLVFGVNVRALRESQTKVK
jgi:hypothetical protein